MDEIRYAAIDVEEHVDIVEPDDGVWLCGCVVYEHICFLDGVGGGQILLGANFVECDKHGGVNSVRDLDKGAGNAQHRHDSALIKFRCGRVVRRVLYHGPIRRRETFVGRVLRERGYRVLEALQVFADGVGNGDVDVISQVIPFDGKLTVLASRWFNSDVVIILEGFEEVGDVVGGKQIDSDVIENKGEGGRQGGLGPKTRGVCHRSVSMGLEVADKAFVVNYAGFLGYVHPFCDLDVDIATCVSNGQAGVINDHLVWGVFKVDPHVLEVPHRVVEVLVDDVS